MLPYATHFDGMIKQMFAQYFNFNTAVLQDIVLDSRLEPRIVLGSRLEPGGAYTTIPAYIAASFCDLLSAAPLFPPDHFFLVQNASSDLFIHPFLFAHTQMLRLGAMYG